MKRIVFLLVVLGVVAIGQESTHVDKCWMREGDRDVQIPCRWMNDLEPVPSGYCPLDGMKGEEIGNFVPIIVNNTGPGCNDYPGQCRNTKTNPTVLRCPHCGMLFSETAKEAQ